MFSKTSGVCLALAMSGAMAQPVQFAPRLTGQQLVDLFRGPPDESAEVSAQTFAYHQQAKGYLDGINDATEGIVWCYSGRWKADERDHALIHSLAKLPPNTLSGNAAPLVLDFLRKKYPCSTTQAQKEK